MALMNTGRFYKFSKKIHEVSSVLERRLTVEEWNNDFNISYRLLERRKCYAGKKKC